MLVLFDDGDTEDFDRNGILQGLELYKKYKQLDPSYPLASILPEQECTPTSPSTTTTTTTTEHIVGGKSDDHKMQATSHKKRSTSSFLPPNPSGSGDTAAMTLFQGMRLSQPNDSDNVNELHCFVRSELVEVFVVLKPGGAIQEKKNVVGLRRVHCGSLSKEARGQEKMAVFFPKSIQDLYRGEYHTFDSYLYGD